MFLKGVTELAVDFEAVLTAMLGNPRLWLAGIAAGASEQGDQLLVTVGLEVAGREIGHSARLELGPVAAMDRVAMLPLRLSVEDCDRLFPSLDGSLDAAWLGPGHTHLALSGTYDPPFGALGQVVDRALLHRVAETVIQRFLESIAHELVARTQAGIPGGA